MGFTTDLTLGALLGKGYFGDVFEGQDRLHGKVAVKVLRQLPSETLAQWDARKDDLLEEAQHLKTAEHPNVVRVLNLVRHDADNKLHMVTAFCDGGCVLTDYNAGPISLDVVRRIVSDVCLGLDHVHRKGMLHRDIKPGNILKSGTRWQVSDFGLVTDNLVNGYGSGNGYADHIAPEVWASFVTSVKSDVWALGMTAYRLVHGHAFYLEHFSPHGPEIRTKVQNGGFALNLPWLQHVSKPWQSFVRRAMHDDTDQRFQNVHEFSQALGKLSMTPVWKCAYSPAKTTWKRDKDGRLWEVVWEAHSLRKHSWSAVSRGGKRDLTLGGSSGQIGRAQLDAELRAFFQAAS